MMFDSLHPQNKYVLSRRLFNAARYLKQFGTPGHRDTDSKVISEVALRLEREATGFSESKLAPKFTIEDKAIAFGIPGNVVVIRGLFSSPGGAFVYEVEVPPQSVPYFSNTCLAYEKDLKPYIEPKPRYASGEEPKVGDVVTFFPTDHHAPVALVKGISGEDVDLRPGRAHLTQELYLVARTK
jgi:hypothetical protein